MNRDYEYVYSYSRLWKWDETDDIEEQLRSFRFPILAFLGDEVPKWAITEDGKPFYRLLNSELTLHSQRIALSMACTFFASSKRTYTAYHRVFKSTNVQMALCSTALRLTSCSRRVARISPPRCAGTKG